MDKHCPPPSPRPQGTRKGCPYHDTNPSHKPYVVMVGAGGALLIYVAIFLVFPISAHAAGGPGRISGQLLDGTKHNAPVAGQSVTLQIAQGDTASDLTTVVTDAQGRYIFSNLNIDKTINYAVYSRYQGAQYVTGLIALSTNPAQQVNLVIYDATTSIANIAIVQATILVHKPDASKGFFTVSELFSFKNLGNTTYVGSLNASAGKPNALRFSLPQGAHNVSLDKGFDGYHSIAVDKGFATEAAVLPGDSQFAFSFEVPYTISTYDFAYTAVYPTVQLSLLVPPEIHATSAALTSQGLTASGQDSYQLLQARELQSGVEMHVQLDGLLVAAPAGNTSALNPALLWLIGGLLFMLAIVCLTWFMFVKGKEPGRHKIPGKGSTSSASKHAKSASTALPMDERQQELLQELLALDKAFEAGKLRKAEYQERRARTKAMLRTLMSTETVKKTTRSASK